MAINVTHVVKAGKLVITVDLSPSSCEAAEPSMSGKTMLIASSKGYEVVAGGPSGWKISYALNVSGKRT